MIKKLIPSSIKHYLRVKSLSGENVHCPICEKSFITFLPFGLQLRANALCPNCASLERTRLMWMYLMEQKDFFSQKRIALHVAPEAKLFEKFSSMPNLEYHPADKFEEGYDYPKGTEDMDITSIQYPDDSFHLIICSHVLEHVPEDAKAMKEMCRVLKPGGFGIIQVPLDEKLEATLEDPNISSREDREKHYGHWDHVRQYGRDYKERLEAAGFNVDVVAYSDQFSASDKVKYGLPQKEDLYVVMKG